MAISARNNSRQRTRSRRLNTFVTKYRRRGDYQYTPLPDDSSFRVMELLPGSSTDGIEINLHVANWTSPPAYEAISYTWGDPFDVDSCRCNGKKLFVTRSLHDALVQFRHPKNSRYLWADAVCIDQGRNQERSHQVDNMQNIYKNASKVLIWLGPDENGMADASFSVIKKLAYQLLEGTDKTVEDLRHIYLNGFVIDQKKKNPPVKCSDKEWEAIHWLYGHSWFSRLWVIQELNSSTTAITVCGGSVIDSMLIAMVANWLHLDIAYLEWRFDRVFVTACYAMCAPLFTDYNIGTLADKLHMASVYFATDPRDIVFALVNSPELTSKYPSLKADYTLDLSTVFRNFAQTAILEGQTLEPLVFISHSHEDELFKPSWVPQWDFQGRKGRACIAYTQAFRGQAHTKEHFAARISPANELFVNCLVFDEIVFCESPVMQRKYFLHSLIETGPAPDLICEAWQALLQPTAQYPTDKEMTAALGMALTCGYDIDDRPVHPDERASEFVDFLTDITQGLFQSPFGPQEKLALVRHVYKPQNGTKAFRRLGSKWSGHRQFFRTANGYIGVGPRCLQVGDKVAVLFGASVPFVLRKVSEESQNYYVLGESYIHGIMYGELVKKWESGQLSNITKEEITIV